MGSQWLAILGAVVVVRYVGLFGVRVIATGVDVFSRWRRSRAGDVNAWKVPGE